MPTSRAALASLAALTAAFSLSACGNGNQAQTTAPAADTATSAPAALQSNQNCFSNYDCVHSFASATQPDTAVIVYSGYKAGGVATIDTTSATPGKFEMLRTYTIDSYNTVREFKPAEDSNTICTVYSGYKAGGITCTQQAPAAPRTPGA